MKRLAAADVVVAVWRVKGSVDELAAADLNPDDASSGRALRWFLLIEGVLCALVCIVEVPLTLPGRPYRSDLGEWAATVGTLAVPALGALLLLRGASGRRDHGRISDEAVRRCVRTRSQLWVLATAALWLASLATPNHQELQLLSALAGLGWARRTLVGYSASPLRHRRCRRESLRGTLRP